jgi:two-component system chemotaxis response regulator CheB
MPERALEAADGAARTLTAGEIGPELGRIAGRGPAIIQEDESMRDVSLERSRERPDGPPTGLTCPECSGALWAVPEASGRPRYRCRIGHAYSEDALVGAQGDRVEAALWSALEVLEERAELLERIAERHAGGRPHTSQRLRAAAADAMDRAELLRRALAHVGDPADALHIDAEDVA